MSRPKSGKKSAKKTPKQQIAELTEQNALLTQEQETLRSAHEQMTSKLTAVINKVIEGCDRKQFNIRSDITPSDIDTETLVKMVDQLIVRRSVYNSSVEGRVEEVEKRLTQMSMDLARATKKTLAYEQGLDDLLQCQDLEQVEDKVYHLQLIAGEKFHEIAAEESLQNASQVALLNSVNRPDSSTTRLLQDAVRLNLHPPSRLSRLPGETHIRNMHKELALYLMKELSVEKVSGADWRMFADKVGIPAETIITWQQQRLSCPMGKVLTVWGESDSATVRLFHRHLMSPQMRQAILAKRISDFYEVE